MSFRRHVAFCICITLAAPAAAQTPTSLADQMVGQWELSTTDRSKTCVVTLEKGAGPQGYRLQLDKDCVAALPFAKDIAAWSIKGLDIVRLQDARGQPVLDLTEVESGIFEGVRQGEGVYLLQDLAAAQAMSRSMDQMIGDWSMVRGSGRVLCGLTLTNNEAGADTFEAFLKPRCDPAVVAFNPKVWKLERGELQLIAPSGEIWHFEADDNAQWRRVPEQADPILLSRQ